MMGILSDVAYRVIKSDNIDFKPGDVFFVDSRDGSLVSVVGYLDQNDWEAILNSPGIIIEVCDDAFVLNVGGDKMVFPMEEVERAIQRQKTI